MTKNLFYVLTTSLIIFTIGFSGPSFPSFENAKDLKVVSANRTKVVVKGNAVYNNPNDISRKLIHKDLTISVNGV